MPVKLKVICGKPVGSYLQFPDGEFVIGRDSQSHIRMDSDQVSAQHCMLRIHGCRLDVRDLGSASGTQVNGRRVEECTLGHRDLLQIGPLVLEVLLSPPPYLARSQRAAGMATSEAQPVALTTLVDFWDEVFNNRQRRMLFRMTLLRRPWE